jgi:hypothetical protein
MADSIKWLEQQSRAIANLEKEKNEVDGLDCPRQERHPAKSKCLCLNPHEESDRLLRPLYQAEIKPQRVQLFHPMNMVYRHNNWGNNERVPRGDIFTNSKIWRSDYVCKGVYYLSSLSNPMRTLRARQRRKVNIRDAA